MKKGTLGIVAVVALAAFGAAYYFSPHWTLRQMGAAAQSRDVDKLNEYVDYPAVRESVKAQFMAALVKKSDELKDNPFGGIAAAFGAAMVNGLVDSLINPEGIAAMMTQGKASKPGVENEAKPEPVKVSAEQDQRGAGAVTVTKTYTGADTFRVVVAAAGQDTSVQLLLRRHGLFSWKLSSIRINGLPD